MPRRPEQSHRWQHPTFLSRAPPDTSLHGSPGSVLWEPECVLPCSGARDRRRPGCEDAGRRVRFAGFGVIMTRAFGPAAAFGRTQARFLPAVTRLEVGLIKTKFGAAWAALLRLRTKRRSSVVAAAFGGLVI